MHRNTQQRMPREDRGKDQSQCVYKLKDSKNCQQFPQYMEKEMATLSSIPAWRIPWTQDPGGATVHGVAKESDTTEQLTTTTVQEINMGQTLLQSLQQKSTLLTS